MVKADRFRDSGSRLRPVTAGIFSRIPCVMARYLLGGMFIWAGLAKLLAPYRFTGMVSDYGILPDPLIVPFAFTLPVLEILTGAGVIFNIRRSLETAAFLLIVFILVLIYALGMNLDADCGCFSPDEAAERTGPAAALCRDIFLLAGAIYLFFCKMFSAVEKEIQKDQA